MFLKENGKLTEKITDYVKSLEKFSLLCKKSFENTTLEYVETFEYDFKSLAKRNFEIDPNQIERSGTFTFHIKHNQKQASLIQNALNVYGGSTAGLARLIQRSNLKRMFRDYEYN